MLRNPLTIWMRNVLRNKILECKYRKKFLKIGCHAKVGKCSFGLYNKINDHTNLYEVELGDYSYIAADSKLVRTKIGKFCSIGPGVRCGIGRHPSKIFVSTHPIFYSTIKQARISFADKNYFEEFQPIQIGNDVFIGANTIILDGVKIGDGAIVAAGTIVSKDIPPYAVVGGAPAKIISYRFEEDEIEYLMKLKWWNKSIDWLKDNFRLFHNIEALKKAKRIDE